MVDYAKMYADLLGELNGSIKKNNLAEPIVSDKERLKEFEEKLNRRKGAPNQEDQSTNSFDIGFLNLVSRVKGLLHDYQALIEDAKEEHEEYVKEHDKFSNGSFLHAYEVSYKRLETILEDLNIEHIDNNSFKVDMSLGGKADDWSQKRRTSKYKHLTFEQYQTSILMSELCDFLSGIDRIKRLLYSDEKKEKTFREIDEHQDKMISYMEQFGLIVIDDEDAFFDENIHDASYGAVPVMMEMDRDIAEIVDKGYLYRPIAVTLAGNKGVEYVLDRGKEYRKGDILLRSAMVKVYVNVCREERMMIDYSS